MLGDLTYPDLSAAPHWLPVSSDDLGLPAQVADGLAPVTDGWDLAFYGTKLGTAPRETVLGWVSGPFGLSTSAFHGIAIATLTHIPTGLTVGTFLEPCEAVLAAGLIAPLRDWSVIPPHQVGTLSVAVRRTLIGAGFRPIVLADSDLGTSVRPAWARDTGASH